MATIQELYEGGLVGASFNAAAHDALMASVAQPRAEMVAHSQGFADSFAGKLVIPFIHVEKLFPGCWPGPAQDRGDCESHSVKNALLGSMVGDIVSGTPDAVSGKPERAPEVSAEGIKNGVLSTEALYWFRGYNGDGWYASAAMQVARTKCGAVVRGPLGTTGIDLTRYSGDLAGKYGAKAPPADIVDATDNNLFREVTEADSFEEVRDMLGRGFFAATDGSESWSNERDANGVSGRTRAGWSHAMAFIGADDRAEIKKAYGEPLVLILNSWAKWNKGPRRILGTQIDIPEGSFWSRWSDAKNRRIYHVSGCNGWQRLALPDYNPGFV